MIVPLYFAMKRYDLDLISRFWSESPTKSYKRHILIHATMTADLDLYYSIKQSFKRGSFIFEEAPDDWIKKKYSTPRREHNYSCVATNSGWFDVIPSWHINYSLSRNTIAAFEWYLTKTKITNYVLDELCSLRDLDLASLTRVHLYLIENEECKGKNKLFHPDCLSYLIANQNWDCLDYATCNCRFECNTIGELILLRRLYGRDWNPVSQMRRFCDGPAEMVEILERFVRPEDVEGRIKGYLKTNPHWEELKYVLAFEMRRNAVTLESFL